MTTNWKPPSPERLADKLAGCTGPGARTHRFLVVDRATGQALSSGGMNHYPQLGVGFLWAGCTVPQGRLRGCYSALVQARLERARVLGLTVVGVYARVDTSAPIVEAQGFERYGRLDSWAREARQDTRG